MSNVTTNPASHNAVLAAGVVGLLASTLVGAAEFSLHFTPTLDYGGLQYEFFLGTSSQRLTFGHFVAIFAAPLYFVGYWHLFQRLKPAPPRARLLLLGLGIYSFAVGAVWIGSRVYPAILIQAREAAVNDAAKQQIAGLLEYASFYNETILIGLRIGVLALSAVFRLDRRDRTKLLSALVRSLQSDSSGIGQLSHLLRGSLDWRISDADRHERRPLHPVWCVPVPDAN